MKLNSTIKGISKTLALALTLTLSISLFSCSPKGWEMDYGEPAAQFNEKDVLTKGKEFVGKKITIKGVVEKVDVSDPKSAWVVLTDGTRCNFGKFIVMAQSYKVGDEVYIDGILSNCEEGDVLIEPAIGRDPKAAFDPVK